MFLPGLVWCARLLLGRFRLAYVNARARRLFGVAYASVRQAVGLLFLSSRQRRWRGQVATEEEEEDVGRKKTGCGWLASKRAGDVV
jgi:hypothetical protein